VPLEVVLREAKQNGQPEDEQQAPAE
jgi:hypothetical protein